MQEYVLTEKQIKSVESVLSKGDRAELIPGPNGTVKVLHIRRTIVNTGQEADCPKC